ncbi:PAS domain S-box protein [Chitinophaga pendula]|uniref:sensor histidine kinase n=1 Tax=Chitinophaga TaxID=79328 RepID=UPI0018DF5930|nr:MULTISPECIES: ATP-binding protein [Chitinophaga]UCJ05044.1 PAS domain S-box protein [Chitinophaga pendula]
MYELAKVTLENEMDLILAHKRSMKLAELTGLTLAVQTTVATAVSEISRIIMEDGRTGSLILCIENTSKEKNIVARLVASQQQLKLESKTGLEYARRLADRHKISTSGQLTYIDLFFNISNLLRIDAQKIDEWKIALRNESSVSPYEELKNRNSQLLELSEKIRYSETQYRILTDNLPMLIFSVGLDGTLRYGNAWMEQFTGQTITQLNDNNWRSVIHEEDYNAFLNIMPPVLSSDVEHPKAQLRIRNVVNNVFFWHQVALHKASEQYWIGYMVDIHAQKVFEKTLKDNFELKEAQSKLEDNQQVLERYIQELNRSNRELQQFAFIASHDLQEPVRKLLFYSDYLLNKYSDAMDDKGRNFLSNIHQSSTRMRNLIQDILLFSQIDKQDSRFQVVDLNIVATETCQDLEMKISEKEALIDIKVLPSLHCDRGMMRQLFANIIGNSLKYAAEGRRPLIEIWAQQADGFVDLHFKDNGIGFDEKYLPKIFTLFQRLHTSREFAGTGVGLAICKKIVDVHRGRINAVSTVGEGSTFTVSIPVDTAI